MSLLNAPGQAQQQEQQQEQQEPGEMASPQEQQAYEFFVEQAMDFIHAEETAAFVADKVKKADTPLEGIAEVVAVAFRRLEVHNEQDIELLHQVMMEVVEDIVTELVNMADSAGILPDEQLSPQIISSIIEMAVAKYLEFEQQAGGEPNPQEKQAQLQQLMQLPESQQGINAMSNQAQSNMQQWLGNNQQQEQG